MTGYRRRDATGTRGSTRGRASHAERARCRTVCLPWARCGSSAAPQIEQPAAKALAWEPQFGQMWGFFMLRVKHADDEAREKPR